MHILLLGKIGQLGWELQRSLAPLGQVYAVDYPDIDLTKLDMVRRLIRSSQPDVIINATAYTAVDKAEREPDLAYAVNATAPGVLAELAHELGAAFVHYSTDFVFDGSKGSDYVETDLPNPLGMYGSSKLEGEKAVAAAGGAYLIFRTSWVYSLRRDSFVTKVLMWARQQEELRVVADQVGSPTWARMLAEATGQVLAKSGADCAGWVQERKGIYHLAGDGSASRYEWAQAILQLDPQSHQQVTRQIHPAATSEFPALAQRPLHAALNCERFANTFSLRLPPWREALQLALETA